MTVVIPQQTPSQPGRPRGSRGNGKTMNEMVKREERKLARIEMETRAGQALVTHELRTPLAVVRAYADLLAERFNAADAEALAAAEDIAKITALRAEQRARVAELYAKQESARAPQFQIDQRVTLWTLSALAAIMFVAAAVLTADGTIGSAIAARFAWPWMGYLLFGVFEIAILVFMLLYYVRGSRVDYDGKRVSSLHWFAAMVFAASVTVAASAYHVMDLYNYDFASIDLWVGIGLRVIAALFFVLVSKGLASVIFAKSIAL